MNIFTQLLAELDIHPVLIDIGASGGTPKIWDSIARNSMYIGFDPDLREMSELDDGKFFKSAIINKAVTPDEKCSEIYFNLTNSPYCSSTLEPNLKSLSNFLYSDLFEVEKQVKVNAITLDSVIELLGIKEISWFKTDTQGTDLRIFNSLREEIRSQILALDIEPGLIDAYIGEDLFVDIHKNLVNQGFWLSNLNVCGSVRVNKTSLSKLIDIAPDIKNETINFFHQKTPGWCEARYLRTLDWLAQVNVDKSDYVMLWIFSLLDNQIGFAIDIAFEYERIFGKDSVSQIMINEAISRLRSLGRGKKILRSLIKIIPPSIKYFILQNKLIGR